MNTVRLNITLPKEVFDKIKNLKNKSKFIADSLEEKIRKLEKQKLSSELIEGYSQTKETQKEVVSEWDKVSGDGLVD